MNQRQRVTPYCDPAVPICPLPGDRVQIGTHPSSARIVGGRQAHAVAAALADMADARTHQHPIEAALIDEGIAVLKATGALQAPPVAAETGARLPVLVVGPQPRSAQLAQGLQQCGFEAAAGERLPRDPFGKAVVLLGHRRWSEIDRLMLGQVLHVQVSVRPDSVRIGPYVDPGTTACLRCLHLLRTERNPDWPWIAERLIGHPTRVVPPLTLHRTAVLIATLLLDATGGHYVVASDGDVTPHSRALARHPDCGCWWPQLR